MCLGKTLKEGEVRREDLLATLNRSRRSLLRENRKAEARANGKAGALNRYGRYSDRPNTLNEPPIPEEDEPKTVTSRFEQIHRKL